MADLIEIRTNLTHEQKINILLKALEERYKSVHIIRERVQSVSLWTLGIFVTATGWLVQSKLDISLQGKIFLTVAIITAIAFIRIFYLKDLQKGFKVQQQIQAKIESALGLCQNEIFIPESIYPPSWVSAGTNKGSGKFFLHNYMLIYLGAILFIVAIWMFKPVTIPPASNSTNQIFFMK